MRFLTSIVLSALGIATLIPSLNAQEAVPAKTLQETLTKLTGEIQLLRADVAEMKKAGNLYGVSLTPAKGTVKFADGKTREFTGLAGVREEGTTLGDVYHRMPAHIVFGDIGNGHPEFFIPISTIKTVRFGGEPKDDKYDIDVTYTNGKRQTFVVGKYDIYIDIQWSGDVPVTRYILAEEGILGAMLTIVR